MQVATCAQGQPFYVSIALMDTFLPVMAMELATTRVSPTSLVTKILLIAKYVPMHAAHALCPYWLSNVLTVS